MRTKQFLALAVAATALLACNPETQEEGGKQGGLEAEKVVINPAEATVNVGETLQLTATVTPEGAATVAWESSNPAVASVTNKGLVRALAKGNTTITATAGKVSAEAIITVVEEVVPQQDINHPSLQGSDYYVFHLGEQEFNQLGNKVVADFRQNSADQTGTNNLYVWDATYQAGTTSGKNFYGVTEDWPTMTVTSVGWSGMAYCSTDVEMLNTLSAVMADKEHFYLHLAMKSSDNASHVVFMDGTAGNARICIGSKAFVDGGNTYQPYTDFTRDGAFHEIEIPMTEFFNLGLVYGASNPANAKINVLGFLSGSVPGTQLQFDAAFIYKK